MTFLRVTGLSAGYGKSVVLRDVDLDVDEGEAVAIVGKNGAGKSTLLMSFFGETTVSAGSIMVGGLELCGLPGYLAAKQGATLSPQGRMILPHLTVKENSSARRSLPSQRSMDLGQSLRTVSCSARAAQRVRDGVERRTATDACRRARAVGQSARSAARRTLRRSVPSID